MNANMNMNMNMTPTPSLVNAATVVTNTTTTFETAVVERAPAPRSPLRTTRRGCPGAPARARPVVRHATGFNHDVAVRNANARLWDALNVAAASTDADEDYPEGNDPDSDSGSDMDVDV